MHGEKNGAEAGGVGFIGSCCIATILLILGCDVLIMDGTSHLCQRSILQPPSSIVYLWDHMNDHGHGLQGLYNTLTNKRIVSSKLFNKVLVPSKNILNTTLLWAPFT